MTSNADIVVAGAGHNSLLAACYLAKAGYRCLVLDARSIPGGGAATEELLLPGFGIDTCATGHTMIRVNPALLHDELGLIADYGLRYVEPDPVEQVAFPDGEQFTMWLDRERTAAGDAPCVKHQAAVPRLGQVAGGEQAVVSRSGDHDVGAGHCLPHFPLAGPPSMQTIADRTAMRQRRPGHAGPRASPGAGATSRGPG